MATIVRPREPIAPTPFSGPRRLDPQPRQHPVRDLAEARGRFAAGFEVSSREAFYETFMLAARESESDVSPWPDRSARRIN